MVEEMRPTYVMLGALGDIANVLPLLWEQCRISGPPNLIVAAKYAPLLDGVSYVRPIVYPGQYNNPTDAVQKLGQGRRPVVCQVHGWTQDHKCATFCHEQWRLFGNRQQDWGRLPLVFDRRNEAREAKQIEAWPTDKPWILVARHGLSSPFQQGPALVKLLTDSFKDYYVIDLVDYTFDRPYDLLGVFERAKVLVTVDTFHLHLAHAVPRLPVVALVSEQWHGSPARAQHVLRVTYRNFLGSKQQIVDAIRTLPERREPKLIHVWSEYDRKGDAAERHAIAQRSWQAESDLYPGVWVRCPARNVDLPRNSKTALKTDRTLPFIRDLCDFGVKHAGPQDWVILTNEDISFIRGMTNSIRYSALSCCWSNRVDFNAIIRLARLSELLGASPYCGTDTFAFRPSWWKRHRLEMPDMLLGCEAWDLVMRVVMRNSGGCELPFATYHQAHKSYWYTKKRNPGNTHNLHLAEPFLRKNGLNLSDFR